MESFYVWIVSYICSRRWLGFNVRFKAILFPSISNRQATLVVIITVAFLIPDTMIGTVSDFLVPQTTSVWGISLFIVLSVVFAFSQYLLLRFVWLRTKDIRSKSFLFNGLQKIVIASQCIPSCDSDSNNISDFIYVTILYGVAGLGICNKLFINYQFYLALLLVSSSCGIDIIGEILL